MKYAVYCGIRKHRKVAPPRGERGLKFKAQADVDKKLVVAPPRGERGLKFGKKIIADCAEPSLPLVGSVD